MVFGLVFHDFSGMVLHGFAMICNPNLEDLEDNLKIFLYWIYWPFIDIFIIFIIFIEFIILILTFDFHIFFLFLIYFIYFFFGQYLNIWSVTDSHCIVTVDSLRSLQGPGVDWAGTPATWRSYSGWKLLQRFTAGGLGKQCGDVPLPLRQGQRPSEYWIQNSDHCSDICLHCLRYASGCLLADTLSY